MRVFISGPVTRMPDNNVVVWFEADVADACGIERVTLDEFFEKYSKGD